MTGDEVNGDVSGTCVGACVDRCWDGPFLSHRLHCANVGAATVGIGVWRLCGVDWARRYFLSEACLSRVRCRVGVSMGEYGDCEVLVW